MISPNCETLSERHPSSSLSAAAALPHKLLSERDKPTSTKLHDRKPSSGRDHMNDMDFEYSDDDSEVIDRIDFEEIGRILNTMRQQESSLIYRRRPVSQDLMALWRKMLIEWMYFVVDYCHLHRQSVAAASFFLDVCMSRGLCKTREEHQLAAATCLQLALKTFDTAVIKQEKLVKLGR